jgi:alkylation response protein AidB-like acyl-CoA dehydrogenase
VTRGLLAATAGPLASLVAERAPSSVDDALRLAVELGGRSPFVGQGSTLDVWDALAGLAASDVALARAVEPHLDALTILQQAGVAAPAASTWGVFAAEGPGVRLEAREAAGSWSLTGTKPWCSLAGTVSHALVTAWLSSEARGLFAVALGSDGVAVAEGWAARGLTEIPSGDVAFDGVPAQPVGEAGWYLTRPGFAWGGMSVAACWFGGAVGIARTLLDTARRPERADDAILLMHLGQVDARLAEARTALRAAARLVDAGEEARLTTKRVRTTVFRAAEAVIASAGHALGPAPLVQDAAHAKRIADLELYLRQHHAERDDVSLGRSVRDAAEPW